MVMTNERILIVDDEENVLELVRCNLDRSGFKSKQQLQAKKPFPR
jgi:DNA-binding response OmpR family regulator